MLQPEQGLGEQVADCDYNMLVVWPTNFHITMLSVLMVVKIRDSLRHVTQDFLRHVTHNSKLQRYLDLSHLGSPKGPEPRNAQATADQRHGRKLD